MRLGHLAFAAGLAAGFGLTVCGTGAIAAEATAARPVMGSAPEPMPAGWTLKGVVLLSRHGMRGPTYAVNCDQAGGNPNNCLDAVGQQPWPNSDVVAGHLTVQGYERIRSMGRYYRLRYAEDGILPKTGCPVPEKIYFIADNDERVVMTAGAVMDGMFPGCDIDDIVVQGNIYEGPTCGYSDEASAKSAQEFAGGSWEKAAKGDLAGPIAALDKIVGPLKPEVCAALGLKAPCSATDVPTTDSAPGVINFLSQPAEQLIVQYGGGRPISEVGWGRVAEATGMSTAEGLAYVNKIHAFNDWVLNSSPYDAARIGSQVLDVVERNVRDVVEGKGASFRFLSSHDNYILNVGGLLGLTWKLPGYAEHQVPFAGSIAFEVWQPPAGAPVVRLVYAAQSIDQIRDNPDLTPQSPPGLQVLPVKDCEPGPSGSCAWPTFKKVVDHAIVKACVRKS